MTPAGATPPRSSARGGNPFHPSFEVSPRVLAGRDDLLQDVDVVLDEGPGSPLRTLLVSGARGMGKTSPAPAAGWPSCSSACSTSSRSTRPG